MDDVVTSNGNGDRLGKILGGIGLAVSVAAIIAIAAEWRQVVIFMSSTEEMKQKCEQVVSDLNALETTVAQIMAQRPLLMERFDSDIHALQFESGRQRQMIVEGLAGKPPDWLKADMDKLREQDKRLQQKMDRIENEVFFGKRKPRLPPYVGD